jgi:hypothetical protein
VAKRAPGIMAKTTALIEKTKGKLLNTRLSSLGRPPLNLSRVVFLFYLEKTGRSV